MEPVVDEKGRPFLRGILPRPVAQEADAVALGVHVVAAVERQHGEEIPVRLFLHPLHAVNGRLAMLFLRAPFLGAIFRCRQREDRTAVLRIPGVPFRTDRDLGFLVMVDVAGRDADMILFGQRAGHPVPRPFRVPIPDGLLRVHQHDVVLPVAVDVGDGEPVADPQLRIQRLGPEGRRRRFG